LAAFAGRSIYVRWQGGGDLVVFSSVVGGVAEHRLHDYVQKAALRDIVAGAGIPCATD
jgi:hypothetical protein